jgi:hypothetical protein
MLGELHLGDAERQGDLRALPQSVVVGGDALSRHVPDACSGALYQASERIDHLG